MTYTSTVECYRELLKIKEDRLKLLQDHQQQVQHHEHGLTRLKNQLEKCLRNVHLIEGKMNKLVENNVWVTAEQHKKIHSVCDKVMKEYSDLLVQKKERHRLVDAKTEAAKLVAGHVLGIERGLATLEQQLKNESLVESKTLNRASITLLKRWSSSKIPKNKASTVSKE